MKSLVVLALVIWLAIGLLAAFQRGYLSDDQEVSCKTAADTALTVAAGPLNYAGANPTVDCAVPQPSE